mmetsp:Transcript_21191/g.36409  ORF Transcript_21191/g.36409 Transcript_21191/m.36409 type:complete len:187 (+) Transcript_21191:120-680(+)
MSKFVQQQEAIMSTTTSSTVSVTPAPSRCASQILSSEPDRSTVMLRQSNGSACGKRPPLTTLFASSRQFASLDEASQPIEPHFARSLSSSETREGRPKVRIFVGERQRRHYHAHSREQVLQLEAMRKEMGRVVSPIASPRSYCECPGCEEEGGWSRVRKPNQITTMIARLSIIDDEDKECETVAQL